MENKHIVEINGCKFEVDLATAKKVEEFRCGDKVKVLKKIYESRYEVYPGIIIGFDWFKELPTITIAYLVNEYSTMKIEFLYYNSMSKDIEISHTENGELLIQPSEVMSKINSEIEKKLQEISELKQKQSWFLKNFGKYFSEFTTEDLEKMIKV